MLHGNVRDLAVEPAAVAPAARLDARLLIVGALPLLQAAVNHQWLFTSESDLDPWIYLGYFTDLTGHLRAFPQTYYGSRLAWIVPGAVAYRIFSPVLANYVLHLSLCVVSLTSLYLTLRWTTRRDVAFLVTVLTAGYPYFLWSMGWNYVDGAGIAYFLLTTCLLTYAVRSRRRHLFIGLAGAAFACAVHTNLMWLFFAPVALAYGLFGLDAPTRRAMATIPLAFGAGGAVLTAIFAGFTASVTGEWLFFLPSFSSGHAFTVDNPWRATGHGWISRAPWLAAPAIVTVLTIAFLVRAARRPDLRDRPSVFFASQHLAFVAIFAAFELAAVPLLELQAYASYFIPVMALACAGMLHSAARRGTAFDSPVVAAAAIAAATLPYSSPVSHANLPIAPVLSFARPAVCLAVAAVAAAFGNTASTLAFLTAVAAANVQMAESGTFSNKHPMDKSEVFRAVVETIPGFRACDPSGDARFWYDVTEPAGLVFRASASTQLWSYRLIGEAFPSLAPAAPSSSSTLDVGDRALIMSGHAGRWRLASETARQRGLQADLLWSRHVPTKPLDFEIACVRIAHRQVDGESSTAVPAELFMRSRAAASTVSLAPDGQSVRVRTNRSTYDWQTLSEPIPVRQDEDYGVDFSMTIEEGGMGIAVVGEQSEVLASRNWCMPKAEREAGIRFHVGHSPTVRIVLSNCGSSPRVSLFSLKDVRIWHAPSVVKPLDTASGR